VGRGWAHSVSPYRRYPISDLWRLGDHPTLAAIDDVLCGELAEQYYFVDEVYRVGAGASLLASALFPLGPLAVRRF
jgi:hypothetical protein